MLEKDVSSLIDVLERERDCYKELLNLARQEQQIVLSDNIDDLSSVVKTVEKTVVISCDLEKERLQFLDSISENPKISHKAQALSELAAKQGLPSSQKLGNLQEEISKILSELSDVNRSNAELIQRNLHYVDFLFSLLDVEDQTYQETGEKKIAGSKLFDQRI